ncbi:hypothetical protein HYW21_03825 [Candidatus Woesearchaeota archaeon]|nr:hypothetical protein [Candidatus Woesearchaeota archaeon]
MLGSNPSAAIGVQSRKKHPVLHGVIILDEEVYDANLEPSQIPIGIHDYEEMQKRNHPGFDLVWRGWDNTESDENYNGDNYNLTFPPVSDWWRKP